MQNCPSGRTTRDSAPADALPTKYPEAPASNLNSCREGSAQCSNAPPPAPYSGGARPLSPPPSRGASHLPPQPRASPSHPLTAPAVAAPDARARPRYYCSRPPSAGARRARRRRSCRRSPASPSRRRTPPGAAVLGASDRLRFGGQDRAVSGDRTQCLSAGYMPLPARSVLLRLKAPAQCQPRAASPAWQTAVRWLPFSRGLAPGP